MALDIEQIQAQLARSFEQIHALSQEFGTVNGKVNYLNSDRLAKDQQIEELKSANRQLNDAIQRSAGGASSVSRPSDIRLIDLKAMNPKKKFDGKLDTPYQGWAKSVRAYCNVSRPGFRKYLRWIEA